jgi:hypothetical protein
MRLFECQGCGNPVHYDNVACVSCGRALGWLPAAGTMTALEPDDGTFVALAGGTRVMRCDNAEAAGCTWLVGEEQSDGPASSLCVACRHNRTVPDTWYVGNLWAWQRIEAAKRHLFYSLRRFRLPCPTRAEDPVRGLAFDFVADGVQPDGDIGKAMTGHARGVITIALAEADDAERERRRARLGEPYRTLLGHFRHEVGHYYWDRLVDEGGRIGDFRALFGDERTDYQAALQRHYATGPVAGWEGRYVSAYAAVHPWEDFAETFAHTLHMVDGLETGYAFGIRVAPRVRRSADLSAAVLTDPYGAVSAHDLVEAWVPFTVAINAVNRSVGQPDLYPFVLSPAVEEKIAFVHGLIRAAGQRPGAAP